MAASESDIQKVIFDSINELNIQLPPDQRLVPEVSSILLGAGGNLDSLGVVNLIVAIEEKIEIKFGKTISLANEEFLSAHSSPYKTVGGLITFTAKMLNS